MPALSREAYLRPPLTPSLTVLNQLREFYRQYRHYILSDGLMYVVFLLALGLLFLFLGSR